MYISKQYMKTDFYKLRTTNQGAHTEIEEQAVTMTENEEKKNAIVKFVVEK